SHLPFAERVRINFDDPQALDAELLVRQLAILVEGNAIETPVYDFTQHVRAQHTQPVQPGGFVLLEGLFALYWEDVRRLAGTSVFVDAPDEICLARRIERDICERGR